MRLLYLLFYVVLNYTLRLYFRKVKVKNKPDFYSSTIYVSNHPAAFMDPLILAGFNRAIVFFMTRSDVFTTFTKPIFWTAHMIPIYRKQDGVDTKAKNLEIFKKGSDILLGKRSLLIFSEGVTDDVFVRRLKPLKKGAVRIGFTALEACDWKQDIYLATVGCNYSNPEKFQSDLYLRNSEKIKLNDFRQEFESNPNKIIQELTVRLEDMLIADMIHVNDLDACEFTEQMMMLQRRGMPEFKECKKAIDERWSDAKSFIDDFNESPQKYLGLKEEIEQYFDNLKHKGISDSDFYDAFNNPVSKLDFLKQFLLLPISIFGAVHCGLFYYAIKRFVEANFARPVFWGSTKLIMMILILGLLNLSLFILLPSYVGNWGALTYFLFIPFAGYVAYNFKSFIQRIITGHKIKKMNVSELMKERVSLSNKLKEIAPE